MALIMARAGYYVAPVRISIRADGRKEPDYGGVSWAAASTRDEATITRWFAPDGPFAGWSYLVDTGKSGIVVVDLDVTGGEDGPAQWRALAAPSSPMVVRTRTGGVHGYYRAAPDTPLYNSSSAVAPGIDIRAIGGCVFGPGSVIEGVADQSYALLSTEVVPVDALPAAPAALLVSRMEARGRLQRIPDGESQHIQREQAYANLVTAAEAMRSTPIGYGLNTAIWRLGAEAGQYGGALGAEMSVVLAWVHDQVLTHPQISQLDADDLRASERGVSAGIERPWQFYSLSDLIDADFLAAGMIPPGAMNRSVSQLYATPDEINAEPEPPSLVAGVIDAGTFGIIYGPGGSGKSFLALDLALSVASGNAWCGHSVTQGRVLYVAAEGRRSAGRRTLAWRAARGVREPEGALVVRGQPVNLGDAAEMSAFSAHVLAEGFSTVVIDTYNRCTPDVEENSAKDTGRVVANIGALAAAGVTVIVVHHTAKDGAGPRGSGALLWASDWALGVEKQAAAVTVTNARQKDRDDGQVLARLVLAAHEPSQSAALHAGTPLDQSPRADRMQEAVLDVLRASPEPMTKTQIALHVRGRKTDIYAAVTALVEAGRLVADGGVDTLTGNTVRSNGADRLALVDMVTPR